MPPPRESFPPAHGTSPLRWCIALLAVTAAFTHAQTISLGDASFDAKSDQVPADSYWPMPKGVIFTYTGFGANKGATRTETYTPGQWVAGIRAVKWHMETEYPDSRDPLVEDWWLALDTNGNIRILKMVQAGSTVYSASAAKTPPVVLPARPAAGQKWDFLGNAMTIETVLASRNSPGALKLGISPAGSPPEYNTYNAGVGLIHIATSSKPTPLGSGWTLRVR